MTQKYIRRAADWGPRVWARIYYPQVLTLLTCIAYASLASGWSSGLINLPSSFEGTIGETAMYMVGTLILIGSVVGIPTALIGVYQVEKWAVVAVGVGLLMYAAIIYGLHLTSTGNRMPNANTIIYAAIMCSIRFWWLIRHRRLLREGLLPAPRASPNQQ